MVEYKTPGVYVVEKNAFPNSIVQVATAVPAFVGYTEKAMRRADGLRGTPTRITSLGEFHRLFGFAPTPIFALEKATKPDIHKITPLVADGQNRRDPRPYLPIGKVDGQEYQLTLGGEAYLLYHSMRLFFQNGGGACYVVSVGSHDEPIQKTRLLKGLDQLTKEPEPTLVLVPEAVRLTRAEHAEINQAILAQCDKMQNRFAILDIIGGSRGRMDPMGDPIKAFRDDIGSNSLDFGAAYYPWVHTSVGQVQDFTFEHIIAPDPAMLSKLLSASIGTGGDSKTLALEIARVGTNFGSDKQGRAAAAALDKTLRAAVPLYNEITQAMAKLSNLLPPGPAIAGLYTNVDNTRGVWQAPANVSMNSVVAPAVNIGNEAQEELSVTPLGASVNAIRPFVGEGMLVYGARTLDGNSLDWRYVPVRRTAIMIEESIKRGIAAVVFEPNDANTWATVRATIENFMNGIWRQGGLPGATPDQAYGVYVGLGQTMTQQDIDDGLMIIEVMFAPLRPAEFIVIRIQQRMQTS